MSGQQSTHSANQQLDSFSLDICILGSPDYARYLAAILRSSAAASHYKNMQITSTSPMEARSKVFSERPDVLIAHIDARMAVSDLVWLRALLNQLRERFDNDIYIIIALSNPLKLTYVGALLFKDSSSLKPSGLIDNVAIAPPSGMPTIATLEQQLLDLLPLVISEMKRRESGQCPLPHLWEDDWVPIMCDPKSQHTWMQWLPRYASYTNENALIIGPTGSGKTRLARALHKLSQRRGPFVSITPRDFSSTELVQAELFGAVAGAYTGAVEKWGLVKLADSGTLFIDELQSIDQDLQGKLITFIENKIYRRVGEADSHVADVRFIFATNRPLHELVETGCIREDFAYRLERLQLFLSSIDTRRLDIAAGASFSLAKVLIERAYSSKTDSQHQLAEPVSVEGLTEDAYRLLISATWPGNLRQLENTIARLVELADIKNSRLIDFECMNTAMNDLLREPELTPRDVFREAALLTAASVANHQVDSLETCLMELEENIRNKALELAGGDIEVAAKFIKDSKKAMELFSATRQLL